VKVEGRVEALIVQECVVTLDPVEEGIDEEVSALFLPEGSKLALPQRSAEGEIILDAEGYRQRRVEAIQGIAHRTARRAIRERRTVELPPMSPSVRRIVLLLL
jgi:hypothetical protein